MGILLLFIFSFARAQGLPADVPNFHEVEAGLYRGGRPSTLDSLAQFGVKTDIDLQGGDLDNPDLATIVSYLEPGENPQYIAAENAEAQAVGIKFYNLQLNSLAPINAAEDQRIDQILKLMADRTKRPLFIHCEHGKDRTGLVVALYRVLYQGWTVDAAHEEWEAYGHGEWSQLFTGQLDSYFANKVRGSLAPAIIEVRAP